MKIEPNGSRLLPDVQIYFCDPQSPWQCGTNENTNLLLLRMTRAPLFRLLNRMRLVAVC
jgi:hypothetical protein